MATFQDNLRAILNILMTGSGKTSNGLWRSGAARNVSKVPNMYTDQSILAEGYTPVDPTTNTYFLENYRRATKSLGGVARAWKTRGQKYPNVDTETKAIMDKIKLPSYADAMTEGKRRELASLASKDVKAAVEQYKKESDEWDEDNFYYKLRAAQALKEEPANVRDGLLNNFNISAYDAKNELDKVVQRKNEKDARTFSQLNSLVKNGAQALNNMANEKIEDVFLKLTGQRKTYTDDNGVKHTVTTTTGPADLDELAERLGDNDSFRLYSKSDYNKGELTDEAKSRGPSAWNSETTNPDGSSKTETDNSGDEGTTADTTTEDTEDTIEYTYKPGDTFGQVIKNLGLNTDKGLWGPDGDVEYYTKQLEPQLWSSGAWEQGRRQNIPIGTTIKLKRRK